MRFLLPAVWIAMALWFVSDAARWRRPIDAAPERVAAEDIQANVTRAVLRDPPRVEIGGVMQKCSDCHDLFESADVTPTTIRQHEHIDLDHGMNDRCFNCHARAERNALVLHDGSTVRFDESEKLCAKCHGTVFRDWQHGTHGRTSGSWDPESPAHRRSTCVACHDPHSPAFKPIEPLPGPRTWRMGEPLRSHESLEPDVNPLERWKFMRPTQPHTGRPSEHSTEHSRASDDH